MVLILNPVAIFKLLEAGPRTASNGVPQSSNHNTSANVCEFTPPGAVFSIPYVSKAPELNTEHFGTLIFEK